MKRVFGFCTLVFALTLAFGGEAPGQTIKIGLIMPLTGEFKAMGEDMKEGFELAISEANAKGGILGKRIVPVIADDRNDPTEASNAAQKLINRDRVKLIVGTPTSKCTIPISDICQRERVVLLSPYATNPKVTVAEGKRKTFIFRSCFIDPFQGWVLARFVARDLRKKTAAVLYDAGHEYSKGLAEFFRDAFRREGGEIKVFESYSAMDVEFSALLTKVAASKPEVLFLPDGYNKVGLIAKQAREKGVQSILLGGDGWHHPDLIKIAGPAVEGAFFSAFFSPEDPRREWQDFVKNYRSRFGSTPRPGIAVGYDTTTLLLNAIERAQTDETRGVAEALAKTKDFQGVTGSITIDPNGNAIRSAVIMRIVKGQFKYKTTVAPPKGDIP